MPGSGRRHEITDRIVQAGCLICHGQRPAWTGANAQGLAAQHSDRTGHTTWVNVCMTIWYKGGAGKPERQKRLL